MGYWRVGLIVIGLRIVVVEVVVEVVDDVVEVVDVACIIEVDVVEQELAAGAVLPSEQVTCFSKLRQPHNKTIKKTAATEDALNIQQYFQFVFK